MKGVTIDNSVIVIHRVLFRPSYTALISRAKCDHHLRLTYNRRTTREAEHKSEKVGLSR